MNTIIRSKLFYCIAFVAMIAVIFASANAQIVIDETQQFSFTNTTAGDVMDVGGFNAAGSAKLVLTIATEHGFNNGTGDVTAVTYNGLALTQAVEEKTDRGTAEIWYLDNPGSIGSGILITGANPNGGVGSVFALSGTEVGVGPTSASFTDFGPASTSITTTSANSLVIAAVGNSGNSNNAGTPTADPPLTQVASGSWGSGWGSHASGYQTVATPSTVTPTFTTNTGNGYSIHTVAAAFEVGPPPPRLSLKVDTATGATSIEGDDIGDLAINFYQITSPGNSLDATGWNSLADQDFDGNGPPNGSGNGWEEGGGSGAHGLAEGYLLGNSTIGAGTSINLGTAYNATANAQDLTFSYRTDNGRIFDGIVEYVAGCNPGDTDGDGDVDTLDLTTAIQNFTGVGGTGKTCADGDADGDGDVDTVDLTIAIQNFTGAQLPEPTLIYHSATGRVTVDTAGEDIISFNLQSGPFNSADFSELPPGLTDNLPTDIGWTSFNLFSGLVGTADIGAILPPGLTLPQVQAAFSSANYGLALAGGGGGGVFDIAVNPEPASLAIIGLGSLALFRRRRAA